LADPAPDGGISGRMKRKRDSVNCAGHGLGASLLTPPLRPTAGLPPLDALCSRRLVHHKVANQESVQVSPTLALYNLN
jgi:hypothetical protein